MTDHKSNAPRRYFVDRQGHRVLIGLSLEETAEFESLEDFVRSGSLRTAVWQTEEPAEIQETRWLELYAKHDEAWKVWITQRGRWSNLACPAKPTTPF
ncbi:hypothetical protein [Bradyrhizobium sp. UFLA05-112]